MAHRRRTWLSSPQPHLHPTPYPTPQAAAADAILELFAPHVRDINDFAKLSRYTALNGVNLKLQRLEM